MAFWTKQGDTVPWEFTLQSNRDAVNLSSASSIVVYMTNMAGTLVIDGGAVTADSDQTTNTGLCSYSPSASDVATAGRFHAEFEVTWADNTVSTFPNKGYEEVFIYDDLG